MRPELHLDSFICSACGTPVQNYSLPRADWILSPSSVILTNRTFVFKWANHFRPKPDKTKESDKASRKRPKGNERGRAAGEEEVYEEVGEQSEAIALGKMKGKGREGGQSGSICNNLDQDKHIDV